MLLNLFSALSSLLSADSLGKLFPESAKHLSAISSILTGSLTALFLTVCPYVFKALANYGGNAASLREAEYKAIRYYWFFILVSAFAGNSLANMITTGLTSEFNLGEQTAEVMTEVARSIPTKVSWQWLSWLVVKVGTNTMGYLLQINTFLFSMCGMKCCARLVAGGYVIWAWDDFSFL